MSARKTDAAAAAQASPALARAVSLHLEGKHKDALKELNTAIENGDERAEIYAAKAHILFELDQFEECGQELRKAADSRAAAHHGAL